MLFISENIPGSKKVIDPVIRHFRCTYMHIHMNIFNNKQHNLTKPIQYKFGDGKIGKKESPEGG